jgi:hypothetical protein
MKLDTIYINIEPVQGNTYDVSVTVDLQKGWEIASFTLDSAPSGGKPPLLPPNSIRYGSLSVVRDNSSTGGTRTRSRQVVRQDGELVVHVNLVRNNFVHQLPAANTKSAVLIESLDARIKELHRELSSSKSESLSGEIQDLEDIRSHLDEGEGEGYVLMMIKGADGSKGGGSGSYEP